MDLPPHPVKRLPPTVRDAVYRAVYRVLRDYATGGRYGGAADLGGPIHIGHIFLRVSRILLEDGIIPKQPGIHYETIEFRYNSVSYPNFQIDSAVADLIRYMIWELHTQRLIAPSYAVNDPASNTFRGPFLSLDLFTITPYGEEVFISSGNEIPVYDPTGYLGVFLSSNPPADPEMLRYLEECIQVFQDRHLLATIVLLHASSERLIQVWAEQLRDTLGTVWQGSDWYKKYQKKQNISEKFDEVERQIRLDYSNNLAYALKIDLRDLNTIRIIFESIRLPRNDIVHWHSQHPTQNEVYGLLHNFVLYFKHIQKIIKFMKENPC